jgi:hypothetical protein
LYNEQEGVCSVTVVISGEHYELPVLPYDECHWERVDAEIQNDLKTELSKNKERYFKQKYMEELDTPIEIKQMRMWSDGRNGYIETS